MGEGLHQTIAAPTLQMPEAEADWLREHYAQAKVILEYGAGGSTVIAGQQPGATVFSVESDKNWAAMIEGYFEAHPPAAKVFMHPVHIGRTGKWGAPVNHAGWRRYRLYPVSVWDRQNFKQPDVVLIDGRFRPACLLTTMLRTTRPVTVLFDDYTEREKYHVVERWIPVAERRGRMVRFEAEPWTIPPADLAEVLAIFQRQL